MRTRITCLCCLLLAVADTNAQIANSYYVDGSQAVNGNGTLASPWNKIWYAVNRTRDTAKDAIVYIKRGVYTIDSTNFLTQLFIGSANGGASGKFLTLRPYTGDEGKVFIDGSKLATNPFYPNMLVISGARYVRLQNLVFRSLKNTNGYVVNVQGAQNIEIKNCAFDTLRWTNTTAEQGYPTVNNTSYFIHAIYLANNAGVTISNDTLRNAALGWGSFVRDAGGNTGISATSLVNANVVTVASDYYVAPAGNDTTGSGSITKPWRTAKRAIELAGINYTYSPSRLIDAPVNVLLRTGTHKPLVNGLFIGSGRGSNNQWFTIKNYPGESPVLDGSSITSKFSALISISDAKFVRIEGLKLTKMTNDSALQNAAPSVGVKDTRFGIIVSGKSSGIVIKKNNIYDMAWTRNIAKQKTPLSNDNLSPLVILGTTDTALRNIVIDSNNVYNNVPGFSEAITINGFVDSFAVTNNVVHDNANIGIVAAGNYQWLVDDPNFTVTAPNNYSRNGFILNNDVYRNISPAAISAGIYLDGSRNVLVQNNESYLNGVGISVGNEQPNSVSGYHLINSNVFRDNLGAGMYLGSTTSSSWVENCVVQNNTMMNNYILDSSLRARANNLYGITDTTQRYTEVNFNRVRNSTFQQNTVESMSDFVLGFFLTSSGLTLQYNTYYVISQNACKAIFIQDKNNDGDITNGVDSMFHSFHQYAKKTGYDQSSSCEGQNYNPNGCGTTPGAARMIDNSLVAQPASTVNGPLRLYPNPAIDRVTIDLGKKVDHGAIVITDASGRVLLSRCINNSTRESIGLKGLKQGGQLLFIRISDGSATTIHKVLVQ